MMARTVRMKRKREETVGTDGSENESPAPKAKKLKGELEQFPDHSKRLSSKVKTPATDPQETVCVVAATAPSENVEPSPSDSSISIWIGTSNREDQTTYTIGVYFGEEDDERNWSGCPELEKYNADDAYVWAATRAIERLENDATRVVIYTECSTLGEAKEGDALREQLHARIKQRSGITQFQHALPSASLKLQKATELAKAANAKDKAVDSLKVEAAAAAAAGIIMDELMEVDGDAAAEEATASTGSAGDGIDKAKDADMTPAVSWRPVFGLRNILEILKAPFVRGTRSI